MANVCVITGGGSGMGLEVAKLVDADKVVISGRTVERLEGAIETLKAAGVDAYPCACDVSDRATVEALAEYAQGLGDVTKVIHAAGVSPNMADGMTVFKINGLGTVNVNEVFGEIIADNGAILNVSSMSAYMLPDDNVPEELYEIATEEADAFMAGCEKLLESITESMHSNMAYVISKNFVIWYSKYMAMELGERGVRVMSISPGTFATEMGKLEGEDAAAFALAGALHRMGEPIEIARMMAFMVSDEASYLTGTDILYDGGAIAATQV